MVPRGVRAVARESLEGLRLEGINDRDDYEKVQPHFKAVLMLDALGVEMPRPKVDAAWTSLAEHEREWASIRADPRWAAWAAARQRRRV